MAMTDDLSKLLTHDALAEAEKVTGRSYKSDPLTNAIGLIGHIQHTARKNDVLRERGDTTLSNGLAYYQSAIADLGFEKLVEIPFSPPTNRDGDTQRHEKFFIYWHPTKAILLKFDTYGGGHVNGGNLSFNWRSHDQDHPWEGREGSWHLGVSGGLQEDAEGRLCLVASLDCREALRHKLGHLDQYGEFLTTWIEQPFLWLLHHGDTKICKDPSRRGLGCNHYSPACYDKTAINAERIALLPPEVQAAIRG